jgi:hypothetical protein
MTIDPAKSIPKSHPSFVREKKEPRCSKAKD